MYSGSQKMSIADPSAVVSSIYKEHVFEATVVRKLTSYRVISKRNAQCK